MQLFSSNLPSVEMKNFSDHEWSTVNPWSQDWCLVPWLLSLRPSRAQGHTWLHISQECEYIKLNTGRNKTMESNNHNNEFFSFLSC